jgi:hypothetical protein
MRKHFLSTILFFFLFLNLVQAQTISMGHITGSVCKGTVISVPFTSTGIFEAGNIFKVQMKAYYESQWTDLITEGTSSPLKATIPENYAQFSTFTDSHLIRVIASKPYVLGKDSTIFNLNIKPNLFLSPITSTNINPYQVSYLRLKGTSTPFTKIVFDDSTAIQLNTQITQNFGYEHPIYLAKSKDYKLIYAENVCGRFNGSGTASFIVNEIGFKVVGSSSNSICKGSPITISYTTNGKFKAGNKFKYVLKQANQSQEYEIEAIDKDGTVEAKLTDNIPSGSSYTLQLVATDPKISTLITNSFTVVDRPSAEIVTASSSIFLGQEIDVQFRITGIGPWNINLSDGSSVNYNFTGSTFPNTASFYYSKLKPTKTQDFFVTSFTSSCGVGGKGTNVMNVVVKPSVTIDTIQKGTEICPGDTIIAKYANAGQFNKSILRAALRGNANSTPVFVPAIFENDIVKIIVPKNYFSLPNTSNSSHYLGIAFSNNQDEIIYNYDTQIYIRAFPDASLYSTSTTELPEKGGISLGIYISGAGTLKVAFEDSTVHYFRYQGNTINNLSWIPLQISKSTSFKLASVSNSCGTVKINENKITSFTVKKVEPYDITIKSIDQKVCAGEKVKVYFMTNGSYKSDNEYRVELYEFGSSDKTIIIGKGSKSPIEVTIPSNFPATEYAYLRMASSNPSWYSEKKLIAINTKPKSSMTAYYNNSIVNGGEVTMLAGELLSYSAASSEGFSYEITYKFSNGVQKSPLAPSLPYLIYPKQSSVITLQSASNECGEGIILNPNLKINILPFKITRPAINIGNLCSGGNYVYSYSVLGNADANTTYNLQIASKTTLDFKDIVVNTKDNPIAVKIPTTFQDGEYLIRLVSNTSTKISSPEQTFSLNSPPTVSLLGANNTKAITIEGGEFTSLKYTIKGTSPVSIVTIDDKNQVYPATIWSSQDVQVRPKKTATFSIKSVENMCGFGSASDSIKVTVTPALVITDTKSLNICSGTETDITIDAYGDYESGNIFKFSFVDNSSQNPKIEVGQTNLFAGSIKLKTPTGSPSGTYQLEVTSTKPTLTKKYGNINYILSNLPDALLSGNTIINAGQSTFLNLTNLAMKSSSNFSYDNVNYILSDGTLRFGNRYKEFIEVKPNVTTTYTLKSAENVCGKGKIAGSVTVIVNPISDKTIVSGMVGSSFPTLCTGSLQNVFFETKGTFSATNKFSVQISDQNGENFKDILSEGDKSPLKVTIPNDLPIGENYRFRVIASDKDVSSSAIPYPLISAKGPTATLGSDTYYFSVGKQIDVVVNLTGTPPWNLLFGIDETSAKYYYAVSSPFTIQIRPINPINYKIFSVSDKNCTIFPTSTAIVKIELITANEELQDIEVKLFPNPTSDRITIQSDNFKNTTLQITDVLGKQILQQNINKSETILDLSNYSSGQYFLQLERDSKRVVYKIMKL